MVPFSAWNTPSLWGGDALALKGMKETAVRLYRPPKKVFCEEERVKERIVPWDCGRDGSVAEDCRGVALLLFWIGYPVASVVDPRAA